MWLKGEVALRVMHACFWFFLSSAGHCVGFPLQESPFYHYVMVFLEFFCVKFLPLSSNKVLGLFVCFRLHLTGWFHVKSL